MLAEPALKIGFRQQVPRNLPDAAGSGNAGQLPQISFSTFILSLASSTLVQLGEVPNPETGSLTPNAELAKHGIDTLAMLRDKITNGLTPDESSMLDSIIYELKMKYVSHSQK